MRTSGRWGQQFVSTAGRLQSETVHQRSGPDATLSFSVDARLSDPAPGSAFHPNNSPQAAKPTNKVDDFIVMPADLTPDEQTWCATRHNLSNPRATTVQTRTETPASPSRKPRPRNQPVHRGAVCQGEFWSCGGCAPRHSRWRG